MEIILQWYATFTAQKKTAKQDAAATFFAVKGKTCKILNFLSLRGLNIYIHSCKFL